MSRILLILLLLPAFVCSQNFIGKNKPWVKRFLEREIRKQDSLTIRLTDNDSVLVYSIKEDRVLPVEFVYGFSKTGNCRSEKVTASCDSCFKKFLNNVLAKKKFGWKKINENQYISKYSARRMIEVPSEKNDFTYTILRTPWNKKIYALLSGNGTGSR